MNDAIIKVEGLVKVFNGRSGRWTAST